MNLHRAESTADWDKCRPSERNIFQKVAATTKGVVTPGNFLTLMGGACVGSGLVDVHNGKTKRGTWKIGIGRVADIFDGAVADITGTKSSLGEMLDATVDKLTMLGIVAVFCKKDIISKRTAVHIIGQNFANVATTAVAKQLDLEIHPSEMGKKTMVLQGMTLGFNGLAAAAFDKGNLERADQLNLCATICELGAAATGAQASIGYATEVYEQIAT